MSSAKSALIVIPARRASTRLPDKLLRRETGKPVLHHTIERALAAGVDASRVWVVCDDTALAEVAEAAGVGAVLTGECASGTERIVEALPSLPDCDMILNLQADEPEMPLEWMTACLTAGGADVVTVAVPVMADEPALDDPNSVKVVLDHDSCALYFSRAAIPALRQGGRAPTPRALRHVGLYAYTTEFLRRYPALPASELEECECLEQLRFLQAGARVRVLVQSEHAGHVRGIDTADDYRQFVERARRG
jgi:3-deoxy-manno-octulosonate cytidylyltransferase (CMP-KDO synthetase)